MKEVEEEKGDIQITLRAPRDIIQKLDELRKKERGRFSRNTLIVRILAKYLGEESYMEL